MYQAVKSVTFLPLKFYQLHPSQSNEHYILVSLPTFFLLQGSKIMVPIPSLLAVRKSPGVKRLFTLQSTEDLGSRHINWWLANMARILQKL